MLMARPRPEAEWKARMAAGDWPQKIEVSDRCLLGFPDSKAHYQVDIFWTAFLAESEGEGEVDGGWEEKTHSFWLRWSAAEKLAKDLGTGTAAVIAEVKAKAPGTEPAPVPFAFPSKWFGDRGNIVEIDKRKGELGVYLGR